MIAPHTDTAQPRPAPAEQPFVEVTDLKKYYLMRGGLALKALDGVSFSIREGEVMGLVGESGCGKSTIARLLMRLTDATGGEARIDRRNVLSLHGQELRRMRRTMQLIFQDPYAALDPRMTLGNSMMLPMLQNGLGTREALRVEVVKMLAEVGLDPSFAERYPRECSGGQLQRIVIGRALLLKPRFLVCDEPTSALDASMRTQILNLLMDLKRRFGLTLLMISHDLRVVNYMCDRIAVMYLGQIVEVAERDELFTRPRHPYTRALISAAMVDETGLDAAAGYLKGDLPSPLAPPPGCRLQTRCRFATERCVKEMPQLGQTEPGHLVRCHRWAELDLSSAVYREAGPAAAALSHVAAE
ncbi:ABC transporter ATP-binding protein [Bosea vaviloviae]|uniref:Peptide ABC transporter ATP-binding protein n=1 Tax=Bosea vaviloviae TaxID=1526658 RepID=A0A1D7U4F3_9HYPH|nr:ABC transporter ATP-binding protein [Bosea vaviloviae]AOO82255.1 peptide ABC transporter ATP-binding protein [Bosea vaviloviae]